MDLTVAIGSITMPNPVGVASGTFGYGTEYEQLMDVASLGAIYTKAVTLSPRPGNDIPRIIETPSGLINSIGLANVGVERFITDKLPYLKTLPTSIIVNVAGSTSQEYVAVLEKLEEADGIHVYEINISCPNVKHGGMAFGTDPAAVEQLTSSLRAVTRRALIVKLTPNVTDITVIARAAQNGGADALSCINTLVGMVIDVAKKKPVLPAKTGGLSGPAIRPVGVAAVYKASRSVSIPVIGLGGIMNADDALQYLLAGAVAIQVGTGTFVSPAIPGKVLDGIQNFMTTHKINHVADIKKLLSD
jgi:dihydroorotate dehydrogenase (NAD+) catalytic subunit